MSIAVNTGVVLPIWFTKGGSSKPGLLKKEDNTEIFIYE